MSFSKIYFPHEKIRYKNLQSNYKLLSNDDISMMEKYTLNDFKTDKASWDMRDGKYFKHFGKKNLLKTKKISIPYSLIATIHPEKPDEVVLDAIYSGQIGAGACGKVKVTGNLIGDNHWDALKIMFNEDDGEEEKNKSKRSRKNNSIKKDAIPIVVTDTDKSNLENKESALTSKYIPQGTFKHVSIKKERVPTIVEEDTPNINTPAKDDKLLSPRTQNDKLSPPESKSNSHFNGPITAFLSKGNKLTQLFNESESLLSGLPKGNPSKEGKNSPVLKKEHKEIKPFVPEFMNALINNKLNMNLKQTDIDNENDDSTDAEVKQEYLILKKLESSPGYFFRTKTSKGKEMKQTYLKVSLIKGIELKKFLQDPKKHLNIREALIIITNLFQAYQNLMKKGILHRDIKPENIMIDPISLTVTFIDFGLSCQGTTLPVSKTDDAQSTTLSVSKKDGAQGTMIYAAPHIAAGILKLHCSDAKNLLRKQPEVIAQLLDQYQNFAKVFIITLSSDLLGLYKFIKNAKDEIAKYEEKEINLQDAIEEKPQEVNEEKLQDVNEERLQDANEAKPQETRPQDGNEEARPQDTNEAKPQDTKEKRLIELRKNLKIADDKLNKIMASIAIVLEKTTNYGLRQLYRECQPKSDGLKDGIVNSILNAILTFKPELKSETDTFNEKRPVISSTVTYNEETELYSLIRVCEEIIEKIEAFYTNPLLLSIKQEIASCKDKLKKPSSLEKQNIKDEPKEYLEEVKDIIQTTENQHIKEMTVNACYDFFSSITQKEYPDDTNAIIRLPKKINLNQIKEIIPSLNNYSQVILTISENMSLRAAANVKNLLKYSGIHVADYVVTEHKKIKLKKDDVSEDSNSDKSELKNMENKNQEELILEYLKEQKETGNFTFIKLPRTLANRMKSKNTTPILIPPLDLKNVPSSRNNLGSAQEYGASSSQENTVSSPDPIISSIVSNSSSTETLKNPIIPIPLVDFKKEGVSIELKESRRAPYQRKDKTSLYQSSGYITRNKTDSGETKANSDSSLGSLDLGLEDNAGSELSSEKISEISNTPVFRTISTHHKPPKRLNTPPRPVLESIKNKKEAKREGKKIVFLKNSQTEATDYKSIKANTRSSVDVSSNEDILSLQQDTGGSETGRNADSNRSDEMGTMPISSVNDITISSPNAIAGSSVNDIQIAESYAEDRELISSLKRYDNIIIMPTLSSVNDPKVDYPSLSIEDTLAKEREIITYTLNLNQDREKKEKKKNNEKENPALEIEKKVQHEKIKEDRRKIKRTNPIKRQSIKNKKKLTLLTNTENTNFDREYKKKSLVTKKKEPVITSDQKNFSTRPLQVSPLMGHSIWTANLPKEEQKIVKRKFAHKTKVVLNEDLIESSSTSESSSSDKNPNWSQTHLRMKNSIYHTVANDSDSSSDADNAPQEEDTVTRKSMRVSRKITNLIKRKN